MSQDAAGLKPRRVRFELALERLCSKSSMLTTWVAPQRVGPRYIGDHIHQSQGTTCSVMTEAVPQCRTVWRLVEGLFRLPIMPPS